MFLCSACACFVAVLLECVCALLSSGLVCLIRRMQLETKMETSLDHTCRHGCPWINCSERPTVANGMVPSCAKIGYACGKPTVADLDHHADDANVGPTVTRRLPPGLGGRRPMSVQQAQLAQQAKLIKAKKPAIRSHVQVRGVRAGATAIGTVKKLRTLKKPPDRTPIAKPLKPLVLPPVDEAAPSSECYSPSGSGGGARYCALG